MKMIMRMIKMMIITLNFNYIFMGIKFRQKM